MRKKGLCMLVIGYLSGVAIAMQFNKKNTSGTRKTLDKNSSYFEIFVKNVISLHKDIYKYFEQKIVSEENMQLIEDYKQKVLDEVETFKNEAEEKLEELKNRGIKKKDEIEKELKDIYKKRQKYLDKAKEMGEEFADEVMIKGKEYINDGKKKLDKALKDIMKRIK